MNRFLYAVHKWISAIAFVQLAVWTVTGFLFSMIAQERLKSAPVEGAHAGELAEAPAVPMAQAIARAAQAAGAVEKIELRATPDGPFYVAKGKSATVRLDARTGEITPVSRAEAEAIARRDQPGAPAVKDAVLYKDAAPVEYRECERGDCPLPAWRVALADAAGTAVWIEEATGDVTTRRNDTWRTYDFVWSLHIMDYKGREDFNHALIRCASFLAIFTVLSGIVLLAVRATRWTKGKLKARRAASA